MHKRVLSLFVILLISASLTFAGLPAKAELAASGTFVKPKTGGNVYAFDLALAAPINAGGNVLIGPKLHLDSDKDHQAVGVIAEVNFLGTAKSGPFIGANGLYNTKEVAGTERYTADAVAGLKLKVGSGGFLKVFASKTVAGRGKDDSDLVGNVGIGIRF